MIIIQLNSEQLTNIIRNSVSQVLKEAKQNFNTPQPPTEILLTVKQAAKYLSLSVPTIYTKVSKNELPFMKRGKRVYFTESELLDYLKKGRIKTNEEVNREATNYISSNNSKKKGVTNE